MKRVPPSQHLAGGAPSLSVLPVLRILRNAKRLKMVRARNAATISRERGPGLAVYGLADYQPGDDARRIDWLASLRLDRTVVREYHREKEREVIVALDASASLRTAAPELFALGRELAATLLAAALLDGERAGALLFTDRIERELPPATGRRQISRALKIFAPDLLAGTGTDFSPLLKLCQSLPRHTLVFVLSDFAAPVDIPHWRALGRRLQIRWLVLRPAALPPLERHGWVRLQDSERSGAPQTHWSGALRRTLLPSPPRLPAIPQTALSPGSNPLPALNRLLR